MLWNLNSKKWWNANKIGENYRNTVEATLIFYVHYQQLEHNKKNKWNSRNSHLPVRVKSLTRAQFAHPATMDVPCWGNCANCAPKQTIGADQNKTNQICTRRRNKQMKTRENSPAALFFIFSKDFEGPDGSRLWPLHQPPFFTLNNRLPFLLLVHTKIINNK